MNSIEKRIRTIRLIASMDRHPSLSRRLQLADLSYYPLRASDEVSIQERKENERTRRNYEQ